MSVESHVDAAYPPPLEDIEARLLEERRRAAAHPQPEEPAPGPRKLPKDAIGFGLSGGGIRSATFSLGLLQALARARLLREIDFLSTVSGGGYIGAFLGRLFTRPWIRNPEDVERVLLSEEPAGAPPGLSARVCQWLRENGRYLAPRGSGDLLLLGSIALRNWVGVQVVLVTFGLTLFVLLQMARGGLDWTLDRLSIAPVIDNFLVCVMPGGNSFLWWSPWLLTAAVVFAVWVFPTGWAYFLITRDQTGPRGLHPLWAAAVVLVAAGAGVVQYQVLQPGSDRRVRLLVCAVVAALGALALMWLAAAKLRANRGSPSESTGIARNVVSRWLTLGLVTTVALLAWTLLDTVAGTIYAVWADGRASVGHWVTGAFGALAGIGAFARQIAMLVASKRDGSRPGPTFSSITWIAAALVISVWMTSVGIMAYAIVWRFEPLVGKPAAIGAQPAPTILGTPRILVSPEPTGFAVTPAPLVAPVCPSPDTTSAETRSATRQQPAWIYVSFALLAALFMSFMFGHTRTFANMSSLHTFYAARLTRTFLGASNERRHEAVKPVTETIPGDDLRAAWYWHWPFFKRPPESEGAYPWTRGGPLHLINVTVNETLDARTGVQHADRKGTGLAIGPAGLSLGVRHHVVTSSASTTVFPERPKGSRDRKVHQAFSFDGGVPEALPLGRWVSISGAAFSAAAGAQTTVPMALLAGMFNVRLGYWWDSGTTWQRQSWFARVFPVQQALLSEALARTRGTADRLWNLSDGGHFENMGGYELIRRRLPIIVIVDAEADPDYVFQGLSDLVRKARIDFNAEVVFYNNRQLSGELPAQGESAAAPVLPPSVRPYFGDLDALRRGRWSGETLPPVDQEAGTRYNIEVNRSSASRAHAALARVQYMDNGDTSWLVYIKATLMGDEPQDVCHYHRAHPEFPQEPTTDQFFDEAQWESYRRLGQHIGHRVLRPELIEHLRAHAAPSSQDR